jgi:hypothetical protein
VTDTDAKSYQSCDPHKVLASQERNKKKKYLQFCLEQHKHFTPFIVSIDGLIGQEAGELLKRLSLQLADKWQHPYLVVRGFISARMSIAIVCATHLCLRGLHVPLSKISRHPLWEDQAGLVLFKTDYWNPGSTTLYIPPNMYAILEFPLELPPPLPMNPEQ